MQKVLCLMLLWFSLPAQADSRILTDCDKDGLSASKLVFFNKAQLIELGECVGVAIIKIEELPTLKEACQEVREDRTNLLAMYRLTVAEAIKMGQCLGVIQYIYNRYHNEYEISKNYYASRVYLCIKGQDAVELIIDTHESEFTREVVKNVLCRTVSRN